VTAAGKAQNTHRIALCPELQHLRRTMVVNVCCCSLTVDLQEQGTCRVQCHLQKLSQHERSLALESAAAAIFHTSR
jgi:hypothetical protein